MASINEVIEAIRVEKERRRKKKRRRIFWFVVLGAAAYLAAIYLTIRFLPQT